MALIVEAACLSKARWEFSDEDFNRVWNVCTVLFLGTAVYVFTANEGASAVTGFFQANSFAGRSQSLSQAARAVLVFIQWLPLVFVPLVVAQALSDRERIGLSTFSWVLRRKRAKEKLVGRGPRPERGINVAYPYFAVVIVATSATQSQSAWFYAGLSLLFSWALWSDRSRRFALPAWIALIAVAIALGYFGQMGLRQLQKIVDNVHADWLSGLRQKGFDAKESRRASDKSAAQTLGQNCSADRESRFGSSAASFARSQLQPLQIAELAWNKNAVQRHRRRKQ